MSYDIIKNIDGLTIDDLKNKIINNDCLEIMKKMPSKSIDAVITSPPYNIRNAHFGDAWKAATIKNGYDNYDDNLPYDKYIDWQKQCLKEMYRLIKDNGVIFYNHKNRIQNGLLQDKSEFMQGLPLRQIIIWNRKSGFNFNKSFFLPTYENIYMICNKEFKLADGACRIPDVWSITPEQRNPHPAPFPEALIDRIISSIDGKIILDPFGGSGTTAFCCKKANRDFITIDLSLKYCQMIQSRLTNDNWKQEFKDD